jgi:transcriptional regulator
VAQLDENDCVLTDKQIGTIRKLVLREKREVESRIARRMQERNITQSQWFKDREGQLENLQSVLDALSMDPTRTQPVR